MIEIAEIEYIRRRLKFIEVIKHDIDSLINDIKNNYKMIAESLSKFLPDKFYEHFGAWVFDDIEIKYEPDDEEFAFTEVFPIRVRIYPSYKLDSKEWHSLFRQFVKFLYEVLPADIANVVAIVLFDKPRGEKL